MVRTMNRFFFLLSFCSSFNAKSTGPNIKVEGGLKSNLQHLGYLSCGKHLVAISLQNSPSTPGQGRSRIDIDPEEKYNIVQLMSENMRVITEIFLPLQNMLFCVFTDSLTRDSTMLGLQLRRVLTA